MMKISKIITLSYVKGYSQKSPLNFDNEADVIALIRMNRIGN
ncbi:MAG: hypothetical protein ACFFAU_02990 [Candidatus Hodarchaeota archaeon]